VDINAAGQVLVPGSGDLGEPDGYLYTLGGTTDIYAPPDWGGNNLEAINDLGQIVGYGDPTGSNARAFILTPVPEPTGLLLLSLGILAIKRRRVRI
jgi:hypothetical protein